MSAKHRLCIPGCGGILVLLGLLGPVAARADNVAAEAAVWAGGNLAWVGDARFSADGQRTQDGQPARFSATGRQLGIVQPWLVTIGASMSVIPWRHVALGLEFATSVHGVADRAPTAPTLALQTDTGSVSSYRVGGNLTGILPVGRFSLRLGATLSYNHLGVPVTVFDKVPCGKSGASRCYPSAGFDKFSLEPRLSATVPLSPGGLLHLLVYIGTDVVPPNGLSVGAGLLVHLDSFGGRRRSR